MLVVMERDYDSGMARVDLDDDGEAFDDLDPEGPSADDLRRFSDETAYCPDCGSEVFDLADVCPKCFAYLGGDTSRKHPFSRWWSARWRLFVVIVILVAFAIGLGLLRPW